MLTRETATLSSSDAIAAGSCGSYGSAAVLTGAPAQSVSGPGCYRYTLTGTDQVGNVSAIALVVTVDTTAPSAPSLTLSAATGANTYISGSTVFINAQAGRSGSFQLGATTTDADSGIQKVNFPALAGFSSGGGDVASSPFTTTYAWSGAVGASGTKTVTATNNVAGTATQTFTVTPDTTAPATGALTVNGSASSSTSTTGSFAISRTDYADAGSGLASSVLTRETATLSSSDAIAAGSCGSYGSAAVLTGAPAQSVSGPGCYRYTLTGTDQVGNVSAIALVVTVDTTAPSAPSLTLSAATGANTYISGSTVFINAQAGRSGSFQLGATTTDADSGIQKVNFPALAGFSSGGGDVASSPFTTTYAWSGAVGASGTKTVTATNNVAGTATQTFTVTPDTTAPATGALTVNGSASSSYSTTGSFAISRTDYTDAGSGLLSSTLTVETAVLTSSGGLTAGTCGSYGSASVIAGSPAQSVSGPMCYRYTLTGTDRVGNAASTTSIVKVDTTAPGTPSLTLSAATGANTYISGSTVFINAQAGRSGSFQLGATTTDADSGIQKVNFPALAGFSSGGGDVASSPFTTTYAWSGAVGASGSRTVTATNNASNTATDTFTVTPDTAGPTVTAIVSKQSGGAAGNGKLESGDQLVLTYSEELTPGSVPSTFSGTETRAGSLLSAQPHVFLNIPNFTNGALDTGDASYLANGLLCVLGVCSAGTASFSGTVALVQSGSSTTVTLTVTALSGDATATGNGALPYVTATSIQDRVANAATGTFTTAGAFKLF